MDAITAPTQHPRLDGCLRPPPSAHDAHAFALDAASSGPDLGEHIGELAREGRLDEFLDQTRSATALAGQTPFLAEQLDPALAVIRDALAGFDASQLPRTEQDAIADVVALLDACVVELDESGVVSRDAVLDVSCSGVDVFALSDCELEQA